MGALVVGALVAGALDVVDSVVDTAPPLWHAVITSRAAAIPAGLSPLILSPLSSVVLVITALTFWSSIHRPRMCRGQPVWNSMDSKMGVAASTMPSKPVHGAMTAIVRTWTDPPG